MYLVRHTCVLITYLLCVEKLFACVFIDKMSACSEDPIHPVPLALPSGSSAHQDDRQRHYWAGEWPNTVGLSDRSRSETKRWGAHLQRRERGQRSNHAAKARNATSRGPLRRPQRRPLHHEVGLDIRVQSSRARASLPLHHYICHPHGPVPVKAPHARHQHGIIHLPEGDRRTALWHRRRDEL